MPGPVPNPQRGDLLTASLLQAIVDLASGGARLAGAPGLDVRDGPSGSLVFARRPIEFWGRVGAYSSTSADYAVQVLVEEPAGGWSNDSRTVRAVEVGGNLAVAPGKIVRVYFLGGFKFQWGACS